MDPFIRQLVETLLDPTSPFTRNRHFDAFNNPEGQYALRISRRLRALRDELVASLRENHVPTLERIDDGKASPRYQLRLVRTRCSRVANLSEAELDLLFGLPGAREALARRSAA